MSRRLTGKVAIVTGAGSGLGAGASMRFAAEGAAVVVTDIDLKAATKVADEIQRRGGTATHLCVDVTSEADSAMMAATSAEVYGQVDVLYCNAGIPAVGTVLTAGLAEWNRALSVMLTGTWLSMRAVLPAMVDRQAGSIIVQASLAGIVGVKALAPYTAAKSGVIGLARQAATDFAPYGIRVNAICPGDVPTPLMIGTLDRQIAAGLKTSRTHEEGLKSRAIHYPLGRLGTAEDIASMALFLASDESSWITGQQFIVDGGFSATHSGINRGEKKEGG